MTLLTQELLKKKLSGWVLSSKVPEHLGFKSEQANEIKQELQALVDMGIVERDGERRGLKFRFKSDDNVDENLEIIDEDVETNEKVEEAPPGKLSNAASLRAYFAERDNVRTATEGKEKTPLEMMSFIVDVGIKDPSVLSHTLSYKRLNDDRIVVTVWLGCSKQYEKFYTLNAFIKLLKSELPALTKNHLVINEPIEE